MSETSIPYVQITQVNQIIQNFPKAENCTRDELEQRFGRSKFSNVIPTLDLLKLINYEKKTNTISLSEIGKKYRTALFVGDLEEAGEIIRPIVEEIEHMKLIQNLLERKKILKNNEIGAQIAYKYGKDWSIDSIKAYGGAVGSILGFCGIGNYSRGVLRKSETFISDIETPIFPSTGFNRIFKITREIYNFKEVELQILEERLGESVGNDIGPCIELGLIDRVAPKIYRITKKGENLADVLNKDNIQENWRKILLDSKYGDYIFELEGKIITTDILGEFLNNKLNGNWKSKATAKTYGKKFNTWLKKAGFVKKIGQGEYEVNKIDIKKIYKKKALDSQIDNRNKNLSQKIKEDKSLQNIEDNTVISKDLFNLIIFLASFLEPKVNETEIISNFINQNSNFSHLNLLYQALKDKLLKKPVSKKDINLLLKSLEMDLNISSE